MAKWFILLITVYFLTAFIWLTIACLNPYKFIMIFGKKGSGKSSFAVRHILRTQKKKKSRWRKIYTNIKIKDEYTSKKYEYRDDEWFKKYENLSSIPKNSLIVLDEIGTIWHCRDYKAMPAEVRNYFKYLRHHKHKFIALSQSFDIDKALRDCTDYMQIVKSFGCLSYSLRVDNVIAVSQASKNSSGTSEIVDDYKVHYFPPKSILILNNYFKYYDSFEVKNFSKQPKKAIKKQNKIEEDDIEFIL